MKALQPWRKVKAAELERAAWPWDRTAWKWRITLEMCSHEILRKRGRGAAPARVRCDLCPALTKSAPKN